MQQKEDLPQRMRAMADSRGLSADHDLRVKADALDAAIDGYFANPPTKDAKQFLGAWARARRVWCDFTGEPLI